MVTEALSLVIKQTTNEINARFNWWGDEATAQMNEGKNPKNIDEIYDEYDDASKGFVNYSGWLDDKDGTPSLVCGDVTGDYFVSALDGSYFTSFGKNGSTVSSHR